MLEEQSVVNTNIMNKEIRNSIFNIIEGTCSGGKSWSSWWTKGYNTTTGKLEAWDGTQWNNLY